MAYHAATEPANSFLRYLTIRIFYFKVWKIKLMVHGLRSLRNLSVTVHLNRPTKIFLKCNYSFTFILSYMLVSPAEHALALPLRSPIPVVITGGCCKCEILSSLAVARADHIENECFSDSTRILPENQTYKRQFPSLKLYTQNP